MSLSASMWTSVTGLLAHGEKMSVVGNNISNVNTVAFKGSRMDFEDFVYQNTYSAAGPAQVGRGTAIGAIYGNFTQGAFENSSDPTDIAIQGEGFFKVMPKDSNMEYYTRAGNFRFDADGYLTDPHGYVLQGWQIQRARPSLGVSGGAAGSGSGGSSAINLKGSGTPTNIKLDGFTCEPRHTNNVTLSLNLSTQGGDNTTSKDNPFFAMFESWNYDPASPDAPAIGQNSYAHQQTITVYDEGGTPRKLTVYFDQVSDNLTSTGGRHWEYMVTMEPSEDVRDFSDDGTGDFMDDPKKGILMIGTMSFDTGGQLQDMSAYVPTGGDETDLANWKPAPISSNGYPMFCPNFTGRTGASSAWKLPFQNGGMPANQLNPESRDYLIELDLGLRSKIGEWSTPPQGIDASAADVGADTANLRGFGTNGVSSPASTVSFPDPSAELFVSQDGYTFGYLSTVYVDRDGILYGKYSNGQNLALYQITLYDVPSPHNLRREGGNLFSATTDSGDVTSGPANSAGFGSIHGNSLEQSNVDLATEFVNMITTQRGFQANSKTITTVDTMLETIIGMKR